MRKKLLCCAVMISFLCSCVSHTGNELDDYDALLALPSQRYRAVYDQDTVFLRLIKKGSRVKGTLNFIYGNGLKEHGSFKGWMNGDTLLANYHYQDQKGSWQRNPIAMLSNGKSLHLGVGQREFAWGRAYFKKNEPIDYDKGRFIFMKND